MTPEEFIAEAKRRGKSKEETRAKYEALMAAGKFDEPQEQGLIDRARGAIQSFTGQGQLLGFGDEIVGGARAIVDQMLPNYEYDFGDDVNDRRQSIGDAYRMYRDDERAVQERFNEETGGAGTALTIGGGIATPANALGKTIQSLRGRTALAGVEGATAGAGMAEELEDVPGAAGVGALTSAGITAGLGKVLRGINVDPEGRRLIDQGVRLTPGQAGSGAFVRGAESIGEVTPLIAHGVKRARATAASDAAQRVLNEATAPGKTVDNFGHKGVQQIKKGFTDAYSEAWSGATSLSSEARRGFVDTAVDLGRRGTKKQQRQLKNLLDDFKNLTTDVTPEKFKTLDNELRKMIPQAKKDYKYQQGLMDLREQLRSGAPAGVMEQLADIDSKYGNFLVLRRAAKDAAGEGGDPTVKGLVKAMKAIGKDAAGEGTAPMQGLITDLNKTVGRKMEGQPLEWFRRVAGITPTPLPMQFGGRVALGETAGQQGGKALVRAVPWSIRRPGTVTAQLLEEEEE